MTQVVVVVSRHRAEGRIGIHRDLSVGISGRTYGHDPLFASMAAVLGAAAAGVVHRHRGGTRTMRPDFRCIRCGRVLGAIEVTALGDAEPVYIPDTECNCPGPRCVCCGRRLDEGDRCPSLGDCPVAGCINPAPDYA